MCTFRKIQFPRRSAQGSGRGGTGVGPAGHTSVPPMISGQSSQTGLVLHTQHSIYSSIEIIVSMVVVVGPDKVPPFNVNFLDKKYLIINVGYSPCKIAACTG